MYLDVPRYTVWYLNVSCTRLVVGNLGDCNGGNGHPKRTQVVGIRYCRRARSILLFGVVASACLELEDEVVASVAEAVSYYCTSGKQGLIWLDQLE
jgi:hypothetical protein